MLLSRVREERARVYQSISVRDDPQWSWRRAVAAGVNVDVDSAYGLTPFYACLRAIAEPIGMLPMGVVERTPDSTKPAPGHRLNALIDDAPNPLMTAQVWREATIQHAAGTGNGLSWIEYDGGAQPKAIWLLRPDRTRIVKKDGRLWYYVTNDQGHEEMFEDWEILHIPGMGWDGCRGYNIIDVMMETLGTAIAQDRFAATFYANGASPSGTYEHPNTLSDPAYTRLKASLEEGHTGVMNRHRALILEEGMKWSQVSVSPRDSQAIETKQYSAVEIARFMRVPASEIDAAGGKDSLTYSTLEQDDRRYLRRTLQPWGNRLERECNRKLFSPAQRGRFFVALTFDALMRGDTKAEAEADFLATGKRGWATPNDIRRKKHLPPAPDGDGLQATPALDTTHPTGEDPGLAAGGTTSKSARAVEALRGVFHDSAERALRREVKALERALPKLSESRASLETWAGPFYADFRQHAARSYLVAVRALLVAAELEGDAEAIAKGIAERHAVESIKALRSGAASGRDFAAWLARADWIADTEIARLVGVENDDAA